MIAHAARAAASQARWRPLPPLLLAVQLGVLGVSTGCTSPTPPAPLPHLQSAPASERLPIDGLWEIEREQAPGGPAEDGDALWESSDPPRTVQLERGRLYLQSGLAPGERHGILVAAHIHQSSPSRYRCRRPVRDEHAIVWRSCRLVLEPDRSLRLETVGERDELRFSPLLLADETWFRAQAEAWHILSAREAHRPPPEVPVISSVARVPSLPPPPEPTTPRVPVPSGSSRFGRYRALVIGSADYTYLPGVATADEDAEAVSHLLEARYGFEVTHLRNPSLSAVQGALDRFQRELSRDDNFLLYWAGHGTVSNELGRCYWIPVDAMGDDPTEGLSNEELATALREMKAKHVMVVADSCFTAGQRRGTGLAAEDAAARDRLARKRTRVVLSSGGLEPIQDGRGGRHSVFTGAFLASLAENGQNGEVMDGTALFGAIRERVTGASQTPEYADIRGADHGGGDFLFVPAD